MKQTNICIVIISRGTTQTLLYIIEKITTLCSKSDEILLVTQKRPSFKIPSRVTMYHKPKLSQSQARNFGIKKTRNSWIAFIDDDCIPDNSWVQQAKKSTRQKNPCIQGQCNIGNHNNIWSVLENITMHVYQYLPKAQTLMNGPGIKLTTKNLIINKNKIPFAPIFPNIARSNIHEDALFLLKLNSTGLRPTYNKHLIIHHNPHMNAIRYIKKLLIDGRTLYWKHRVYINRILPLLKKNQMKPKNSSAWKQFDIDMNDLISNYLLSHVNSKIDMLLFQLFWTMREYVRKVGFILEYIQSFYQNNTPLQSYLFKKNHE